MAKVPWNPMTAKLSQAARVTTKTPGTDRFFLNKSGSHTRNMTSSGQKDRIQKYAVRRQLAVAKIMTIGEVMRDAGAFTSRNGGGPVNLSTEGAFWQTVAGTELFPACHTAPALLLFDRHLPTILPQWAGLTNQAIAQQIVLTFAECVLMPQFVNRIDQAFDENFGGKALVNAMELVLDGTDAIDAAIEYQREMVSVYRQLLQLKTPTAIVYELGRLNSTVTRESLHFVDPNSRLEDVYAARLDDPNREVIQILCDTNCRAPNETVIDQFRELLERELD